jgi:hypothetical protein
MQHTKRFQDSFFKTIGTIEIKSLRMILETMKKVSVTCYRNLNTENNCTKQKFHVMS